ncbi:MAG: tetratricopeptide repeat protein [Pseudomonadales bacterium]|nr:tetratricopeptide repeat protein [Pseudomonadales bacterium]
MKTKIAVILIIFIQLGGCATIEYGPQSNSVEAGKATSAATGLTAVDKLINKGDSQRRRGDFKSAAATLERALRLAPNSGAAFLALARLHLDQHDYLEAQQLAEKSLSLSADSASARREAWLIISRSRRQLGDVEGAQQAARKAQRL